MTGFAPEERAGRQVRPFNLNWGFCYDPEPEPDPARSAIDSPAGDFTEVALPHTWQTFETTGCKHPFVRDPAASDNPYWWHGWGWYRKVFRLAPSLAGRRVFVEFDGAQKSSLVYCNGRLTGRHAGGFSSFSVEITDAFRWDGDNVLAVAVSARQEDLYGGIPPMTAGNWTLYGGLYREARLVVTSPLYIPFQGSAEQDGGTRVTTPVVSRERARVRVETWLRNTGGRRRVRLVQDIVNAEGGTEASFRSSATVPAGRSMSVVQDSPEIRNPRLWSPEDPYCYKIVTRVVDDEGVLDSWHSPLGFRWFRWDREENALYMNDRKVKLTGMNRHQEYPWLGDAVPWWIHQQELAELRYQLGVNFARWCHYPHDRRVYDWCDRHGVIVCEEVPNIKSLPFAAGHQRQQVLEMIRRDRNHPCIIMWSMGNETDNAADGRWALEEDRTRLIHYRKVEGPNPLADHTHEQLDFENMLRCTVRGWWEAAAMDKEVAPLPGDAENGQITGTEAWQHAAAKIRNGSIRGRVDDDTVVWIYADHGADREYRHCPLKHVNPKGWVDAYRQPKEIYWLWQANRTRKLMVHVRSYWWRPAHLGTRHDMVVDSNGSAVELFVGQRSYGIRKPGPDNFFSVEFAGVMVEDDVLRVVAHRGDDTVEETVPMPGPPAALRLQSSHGVMPARPDSVALLKLDVVDGRGHPVAGARPPLSWRLAGPGRLVGPEEWQSDIDRREQMEGTMYIIAPVVMPVRALGAAGRLTVRVTSPGLRAAECCIELPSQAGDPAGEGLIERPPPAGDGGRLRRQRRDAVRLASVRNQSCPQVYADLQVPATDLSSARSAIRRVLVEKAGPAAADALADRLAGLARAGEDI